MATAEVDIGKSPCDFNSSKCTSNIEICRPVVGVAVTHAFEHLLASWGSCLACQQGCQFDRIYHLP